MSEAVNEAVTVTHQSLIALRQAGERLAPPPGRIRAARAGGHRSPFKGRGMEFEESRRYQPGDDIRTMDWRVTARTGEAHTKLYREERERPALFGVDLRPAMFFATRGVFKSVMACRLAALLAWGGSRAGDRVGGVVWTGAGHREIRPQRGAHGVLALIRVLSDSAAAAAAPGAAAPEGMEGLALRLRRVAHPGTRVYVASDFRGLSRPAQDLFAQAARHSDVVFIMVHDPIEAELPPAGRYRVRDGDRELLIDTRSAARRRRYRARFQARRDGAARFCAQASIQFLVCPTDAEPVGLLRRSLAR